jgi:phage antirepressor YoqD-like protein
MNELQNLDNVVQLEEKMTVKKIAQVLGVSYELIIKTVKELFPEAVQNGITTYLSEGQVAIIKIEIEKNPHLVQSYKVDSDAQMTMQLIEAGNYFKEKYQEVKKENLQLKFDNQKLLPKAEFYDTVTNSKDAVDMAHVAKVLNMGIGRNKLFDFLRKENILMNDNIPYQKFIDIGYFRVIEQRFNDFTGSPHISFKTVVYQTGMSFIKTLLSRKGVCK